MSNDQETIFDMMPKEEATIFPGRAKSDESIDALRAIFQAYRKESVASMLDNWKADYRNAQGLAAKAEVLKKRDEALEYERESQSKAIQQEEEAKFNEYAAMPRHRRNKTFWEGLKANNPVLFWSKLGTELRIADKAALGLAFHLKNGG